MKVCLLKNRNPRKQTNTNISELWTDENLLVSSKNQNKDLINNDAILNLKLFKKLKN